MANPVIKIPVNNHFYNYQPCDSEFSNELSTQDLLKRINSGETPNLYIDPKDQNNTLKHINILSFRNTINNDEPKLVYDVLKSGDICYIKTGLFVGYLTINGIKLEINTGYKDFFLRRMLNVANNIYFDNTTNKSGNEVSVDSFLNLILEYLFLTAFKNAFALGMPSLYKKRTETGLNIKGRIKLKRYISHDIFSVGKITYDLEEKQFDQDIIDVLFLAFNSIDIKNINKIIKNGEKYYKELKRMYSGHLITKSKLKSITNKKSLKNPMFSKYKIVLKYARYILEHKNIVLKDHESVHGISGFLLDISELWEVYLANLLKNRFVDYEVNSQVKLDLYEGTFFERPNSPDIIMESTDKLAIIDAKFKSMSFENKDVDRSDLHQMHSYAGYYAIAKKDKLRLTCLVYPSNFDCERLNNASSLYGLNEAKSKFSIEYIKIGENFEQLIENENAFLDRIDNLMNA